MNQARFASQFARPRKVMLARHPGVLVAAPARQSQDAPVITIRGSNIDLDLSGVELIGSPDSATPDQYAGLAILIDGGEHVSIRNAHIRGFKVGILARNVKDLRIEGNDVSRNWKQRLYSRVEKESPSTGCRITRTRRTSGCATARAST